MVIKTLENKWKIEELENYIKCIYVARINMKFPSKWKHGKLVGKLNEGVWSSSGDGGGGGGVDDDGGGNSRMKIRVRLDVGLVADELISVLIYLIPINAQARAFYLYLPLLILFISSAPPPPPARAHWIGRIPVLSAIPSK